MRNKIKIINSLIAWAAVFALVYFTNPSFVFADNVSQNCSGNICATISDNLATGATGIDPNKSVQLSFTLVNQSTQQAFVCSSGNLYHFVKHYINGQNSSYEYLNSGAGPSVQAVFDSGSFGQRNKYNGIFYCSTNPISGSTATIDSSLGVLAPSNLMWQTNQFDLTTRQTAAQPTENPKIGGTVDPTKGPTVNPLANGADPSTELRNPIETGDLLTLFTRMLKILMSLLGVISVATIVLGGFQMVLAQGNEEAYGKAKKTITWAVLGLIIALLSFAMILIVQSLLGAQLGNPKDYIN